MTESRTADVPIKIENTVQTMYGIHISRVRGKYEKSGVVYQTPKPLHAAQAKIFEYAELVAKALGYEYHSDLSEIAQRLGGKIHTLSLNEYEENLDGTILVHGSMDFDILISSLKTALRNRFTIAHELAHYFLHSRQGETPIKAARVGTNRLEWEANWFAAAFLMPAQAVRDQYRITPNLYSLSGHFNVSASAMSVRLQSLGL